LENTAIDPAETMLIILDQKTNFGDISNISSKTQKGKLVYSALKDHAMKTQVRIQSILDEADIEYRCYCIANVICADVDAQMIKRLSRFEEVKAIVPNASMRVPDALSQDFSHLERTLGELPWGLTMIGADKAWEMGYRGQGVVVGGHDTGVDWRHPALINNYRGWQLDQVNHNYNWHDAIHAISPLHKDSVITETTNPCGLNILEPCDDAASSHGTHTVGTMVGEDPLSGMIVGVAPEAEWIAVRNMERGYGSVASYLEGFEWFLAPSDLNNENPDPTKAPDIINNSWACIEDEGCNLSNFSILETAINNLRMAGILVVASAGNSGAGGCATITNPPAIYDESLTVGSTDPNDSLSSFSSRGPVTIDQSYRMKPDVTAPGRGVLSSIKGNQYGMLSGTSMAGPHVAGLAALMISANPELAGQVDLLEDIIRRTAVIKSSDGACTNPDSLDYTANFLYGYGRINALEAVNEAVNITTSTQESKRYFSWHIFPNPADNFTTISAPDLVNEVNLVMFDLTGRKIREQMFSGVEKRLELGDLPGGAYLIKICNPKGFQEFKLLQIVH
jgi:subtilisin family serine protease